MKNFKKLTAMIAALALSACAVAPMALSSFAAGITEYDLSLVDALPTGVKIASVSAYKVFSTNIVNKAVNVTGWGTGVNASAIKTAWEKANNTIYAVDGEDGGAKAIAASLNNNNAAAFAKIVANNVSSTATATATDWNAGKATFASALEDGYYLFTCVEQVGTDKDYKSNSLGMLMVVDNVATAIGDAGKAKVGLPQVVKKVQEDSTITGNEAFSVGATLMTADVNDNYNDIADYGIGEAVPFKLYGTLPQDYANYESYKYEFHDNLDGEFDAPTAITVKVGSTPYNFTKNNDGAWTTTATLPEVDSLTIEQGIATGSEGRQNKTTLAIKFADLKKFTTDKDVMITVEYRAVLNSNAVVGTSGQDNEVTLKYSNNPNQSGDGDTGETPEDKVRVYTYGVDIDKTFYNVAGKDITIEEIMDKTYAGVKFKIHKDTETAPEEGTAGMKFAKGADNVYYPSATGDEELELTIVDGQGNVWTVNDEGTAITATINDISTIYYYDADDKSLYTDEDKTIAVDEDFKLETVVKVKGLDAGNYWLDESSTPDTFNPASQKITIEAKGLGESKIYTQTFSGTDTLNKVKEDKGSDFYADYSIQNRKGTSLPSTGGIGTTIFYLGGGAMVAVAGVFLITKRRMKKDEA